MSSEELLDVYRSKRKDEKMIYADVRNILVEHTKPKTAFSDALGDTKENQRMTMRPV